MRSPSHSINGAAIVLALAALGLACSPRAAPRSDYGDVAVGPCRRDADCPTGQRCLSHSAGHLWNASGEIVGDTRVYTCEPVPTVEGNLAQIVVGATTRAQRSQRSQWFALPRWSERRSSVDSSAASRASRSAGRLLSLSASLPALPALSKPWRASGCTRT